MTGERSRVGSKAKLCIWISEDLNGQVHVGEESEWPGEIGARAQSGDRLSRYLLEQPS